MKVLHFYKTYLPDTVGGVEQVIYQIASGSATYGIDTEVLSLSKKPVEKTIQINNHLSHRAAINFQIASTRISLEALLRFSALSKRADIIHYHFPWPFMDVVHFATRIKKPTVVTYHSDVVRQKYWLKLYRPLKKRFLNAMDCIVATSPNYLDSSVVLNRYRHKTQIVPIGIDESLYPTPTMKTVEYWRSKIKGPFFLFIGVFRYYKGLHILLEAISGTHFPVVIVGRGPLEKKLKKQAEELGIQNVYFVGKVSDEDKVALIKLCYAVVFPSHLRSESFGVFLLEGAMFGKPLISCEISTGTSYVNVNGETGIVVPPSNPILFRQAMQYLWDNPSVAKSMGERARMRYQKFFTADQMVRSYVGIYYQLLSSQRG